ncbi:pre-mRNA-splicing factor CWC25 homolog [Galleria mellonella]|uniref:Pre-mRNA-splicing factor CWC25 homolog n=1 Tax=Galleria mellonella TaxID=7137 RepID=A0A6J3BV19_GALME|nr:pre-mRNA-splicing factor CWC25 homolog [Galleria mellonella]XP_031763617.2 pre-mRNA-splicing factor CWC25 homolog [Galleria mellonella]XP_031763618.2 pre-mRNA-splicing factor CWC25 homolog [Galleria mellonella]XP_031763619.2 pre-mRNA-splicing factor CWC25 homolog [Galleria mellonella]XP_031763620.2 pre-mRNA-splicing factor CWC25 homolog [Galleria mellonella]XP_031763621.2 pre-mRNA-splicing factor CWC25 homolog [Galleria mellonella]XP_052758613.1 pre-mRNA-splicing factor CWC25 homolog [Gall
MGGGDLNTKKSWHPNTMKNQERVWKAEQLAAEEKRHIQDLQRERAEERDREELNSLARLSSGATASDNRLHWMYDKPDKKAQQEDYLLGKSIEKNYDQPDKSDQDVIPAVARRVVGSSMLSAAGDTQVDLARKIREDPLLLVKERERAARAALLNNPLQRRRLTELLRKEQDQRKESKEKKKPKKKEKDLDNILAAKLSALVGDRNVNISTLLASDSSTSESSSDEDKSRSKKKKKKHIKKIKKSKIKKKKHKYKDDSESEADKKSKSKTKEKIKKSNNKPETYVGNESRKRRSDSLDNEIKIKKQKTRDNISSEKTEQHSRNKSNVRHDSGEERYRRDAKVVSPDRRGRGLDDKKRKQIMSEEEKAARLATMAAAGAEREVQRGRRVAAQRAAAAAAAAEQPPRRPHAAPEARSLPDSLETRIHSNRHYIQRDRRHMDEHFARR